MKTIKTVVFISNFFNHHQKPFSDAMYERLGAGYLFIETSAMSNERKNLGWSMDQLPSYVVPAGVFYEQFDIYKRQIDQADVVIVGSASPKVLRERIAAGKLIFRYAERPLKKGMQWWRYPDRFIRWRRAYPVRANVHLLCASAYAAGDYALFGMYRNRCYKWGYFPKTEQYQDVDSLISSKKENSMIWVGRFIDWKHPEIPVEIAQRLKAAGYSFHLNMVGNGAQLDKITRMVKQRNLDDVVHILGAMTPTEVRRYMEQSQIHLFTSDRNEGWGAVLNESMNSACVPVANREIGSVPFLVEHGRNGCQYSNVDELYTQVKRLLNDQEHTVQMAKAAYDTILSEWNAEAGAERFLQLAEHILTGKQTQALFSDGMCSKA